MQRLLQSFVLTFASLWAVGPAAQASGLTGEQQARLEASVNAFHQATEANDALAVVNFMPPIMISRLAQAANASEAAIRETLAAKLRKFAEGVAKSEFLLDLAKADEGTAADGTAFAIVPTKLKIELKDGMSVKTATKVIAFEQAGQWYLLALTDQAINHDFYDAYPQFKGVDTSLSHVKSQGQ